MKRIPFTLVQRPPLLSATIIRAQSSDSILSSVPSRAKRSCPEPANPRPKAFFERWLDAWRSQNGGDHGQSR
jgi:hypothetical protein